MKNNQRIMWGLLFMWVLGGVTLASCEKAVLDDEEEQKTTKPSEAGKKTVVLRVSGFRQVPFDDESRQAVSATRAMTDLTTYCTRLVYVVYKDGKKVDSRSQMKGDSGFGEVSMSLMPDTYKLLILAHSAVDGNPTVSDPEKIQFTNALGFSDTFSFYGDMVVSNEAKTHEIILTRNVSCLRFTIKDDFPSEVKWMKFYYTGGSGVLNAVTGYGGAVNSQQEKKVDVTNRSTPLTFNIYTFLQQDEGHLQLTVKALKADETTVVVERTFENVPMKYRMVTEYTGYFFDSDNAFSLMADTDWGDPYYQEEY